MSPDDAIIKAGYKCKTKEARANQAARLNKFPEGIAYKAGLRKVQQTLVQITSKEWLEKEIERAYSSIADVVSCDTKGVIKLLKPLCDLPRHVAQQIAKIGTDKDGCVTVKMHPNQVARTNIGRHLGVFEKDNEQLGKELAEKIEQVSREKRQEMAKVAEILLLHGAASG